MRLVLDHICGLLCGVEVIQQMPADGVKQFLNTQQSREVTNRKDATYFYERLVGPLPLAIEHCSHKKDPKLREKLIRIIEMFFTAMDIDSLCVLYPWMVHTNC